MSSSAVENALSESQRAFAMDPNQPLDVVIVGSGPIGAVFARTLVDKGLKVLMIDMGEQATRVAGDHKKNNVVVQKDISLFTHTVKGDLRPLSVPTSRVYVTRDPACWAPPEPFTRNGQNPDQGEAVNLPGAAASRVVGGMGSHWTCCTPRQHLLERSDLYNNHEWEWYYKRAEELFNTNTTSFDQSIRHQLILDELRTRFPDRKNTIQSMPLACQRVHQGFVKWSCSATILGRDLLEHDPTHRVSLQANQRNSRFQIWPNTQCVKLKLREVSEGKAVVDCMKVKDLLRNPEVEIPITAKKYVICAGAVLTLGILHKSGFSDRITNDASSPSRDPKCLPAMGHYMTEQTLAFCQVILRGNFVEEMKRLRDDGESARFSAQQNKIFRGCMEKNCDSQDPVPFPKNDPDPQVCVRYSAENPWHMQIHRDAFGYGEVPRNIDQRLVVDLRAFGYTDPNPHNRVWFNSDRKIDDGFDMPQPTFKFKMGKADISRCDRMLADMVKIARRLGGFLPGAEPKFLPMGSALHICGTYRAGTDKHEKEKSVVDRTGKVHGIANLVLGGCGVIPTANACNPTLTAAAFALAAADQLVKELGTTATARQQTLQEHKELIKQGPDVLQTLLDNEGELGKEWPQRVSAALEEQQQLRSVPGVGPGDELALRDRLSLLRQRLGQRTSDEQTEAILRLIQELEQPKLETTTGGETRDGTGGGQSGVQDDEEDKDIIDPGDNGSLPQGKS